jgi:hypothetical protein
VGRVAFKRRVTPLKGNHVFALPSCLASVHLPCPPDGEHSCCFRLAVVGGTQLRRSWYLSAIVRLQGFSSSSPAASPRRWSPKTVTTSLMVGRSEPSCGLCPTLSFKDLHHPCWGGERCELVPFSHRFASGDSWLRLRGGRPSRLLGPDSWRRP